MSLTTTLSEVFTRKRLSAEETYYHLIREGKNPEAIATAAESAGITESQAQEHAKILEQAGALSIEAIKLPSAIAARVSAVAAYEKAARDLQEAIQKLQPLAIHAELVAVQTQAVEDDFRRKAEQLRSVYLSNPKLLPMADAPATIKDIDAEIQGRDDLERAKRVKHQRYTKAREAVADAEYKLAHAGDRGQFMGMPTSLNGPDSRTVDDRQGTAQAELNAAQAELDSAVRDLDEK